MPSAFKTPVVLRRPLYLILFLAGCATQQKTTSPTTALEANLHSHVAYLSADSLEGRRTGTRGEALAARYIADAFQKEGLQPRGTEGYFQPFPVSQGMAITSATTLSLNGNRLQLHQDFFPFSFSHNGTIQASASVALLERGEPWFFDVADLLAQNKSNPHFDLANAVLNKAAEAAKKGATAFFVFNSSKGDDGLRFSAAPGEHLPIPVIYLTRAVTEKYLKDPAAFLTIAGTVALEPESRSGKNVAAYIDNGAPYTIIIGAHYDHLGYGEDHNSRYTGTDRQIHNGADDNASGTAALLELARLVKKASFKNNNVLFLAFSGEELGLFGSKYFVEHPTVELDKVNFMVNMDMIGRLNDSSKTLTVGGYGTSPAWGALYSRQGKEALYAAGQYRFDSSGTGPSDHTSFYRKNIPVLFYFTGLHSDYHMPADDYDKINYSGEAQIVQHIFSLLQAADKQPGKLPFTKTREAQTTTSARFSVSLGIMPDYTFGGTGVRVDGVSEGRAAQAAGLREGDVITALGSHPVTSLESYMQALATFHAGDKTTVHYTRNGRAYTAEVTF